MLTVKEVYEAVNGFAPFASQESWDNSGLLVGSMTQPADRILTTLDISEEVIAQAVQQQVQLIVAHHPVIFSPLKALPQNSPVYQLAAHGIAAICVHTPLDMSPVGLNAYAHGLLAEPLALENAQSVLEPSWTDGRGFGWIDTSTRTWTPQALAQVLELELSQLTAPGGCAEEERKQEAQSREARRNAKMLLGRWSGYLLANTGWDGYLGLTSTLEAPYYWLGITAAGIALLFLTSLDMRRRTRSSGGQLALETLLVLCIFCGKGLIPPLPHGLHVLLGELPVIACMAVLHLRYWRRIWVLPETASRRPKKRRRDRTDA